MNYREFFDLVNRGALSGSYLLHGEEEYVKLQAVNAVKNTVEADFRPFNICELTKPSPQELYEACETMPFFSDKRFVLCYELAEGTEGAKYSECFEEHSKETVLLFVLRGKLAANLSLVKLAQKKNAEVLFEPLSTEDRIKWCMKRAAGAGVNMNAATARLAVTLIGGDMSELVGETDKLIDYAGPGGTITPETVSFCVRPSLEVRIFDMLDTFTYGKPGDGIKALHKLLDEGSEPMSIAAFLVGRFKLMLETRRGIDAGRAKREVVSAMEGSRYANERAFDASRRFTQEELLCLIAKLSDTSYLKISGSVKDDRYLESVLLSHEWRQFPV